MVPLLVGWYLSSDHTERRMFEQTEEVWEMVFYWPDWEMVFFYWPDCEMVVKIKFNWETVVEIKFNREMVVAINVLI